MPSFWYIEATVEGENSSLHIDDLDWRKDVGVSFWQIDSLL